MILLRPWADADLDCVRQASVDLYIPEVTTVPVAFSAEAGRAFIARQDRRLRDGEGMSMTVIDVAARRAIGATYLAVRPQAGVLGLGYWIIPAARRRGLSTRAVQLISAWALLRPQVARIEAWVEPRNEASQRTLATAGYRREGTLRSFLTINDRRADAVVFSRTNEDR